MFKDIDRKEEKEFKGDVLFITRNEDVEIEKLLDIIFRMVERYVKQEGRMPSKIMLSQENYNRIKKYRKNVIDDFNGVECILCTEIKIDERKPKIFKKIREW